MQAFKAGDSTIAGVAFTPDGRTLVVSSHPHLSLWDVTGAPQLSRKLTPGGYGGTSIISPCGQFLAHSPGGTQIFDLTQPGEKPLQTLDESWGHAAFAPDGTELAKAAFTPRQWEVPSWKVIRENPPHQHVHGSPFCNGTITYSPDGRFLAGAFSVMNPKSQYDYCFRLFDRATGAYLRDLRTTFGHTHPTHIAFSPDGEVLAGNFGPVLGVVSVADGKQLARIKVGTKHVTALGFTPDGSKCVTVSNDTRVRVYDTRTWTETGGYEWKIGKLRCLAVAPDGLRMAAGSDRGKVVIWDVDG